MTDIAASTTETTRRVDWLELFFDLAFVAFIAQVAHGLHGEPGPSDFFNFLLWTFPAWWAWTNIMVVINLQPTLQSRKVGVALLCAMVLVIVMAASVVEDTERAWAFALGCAGLRLVLLFFWMIRARIAGLSVRHIIVYNGLTALIWVASVFFPEPFNFVLWGVAILVEVGMLMNDRRRGTFQPRVDPAHASERLSLFMIILMGESVLSVVSSLGEHWTVSSAAASFTGFLIIAFMAWGFFMGGTDGMEAGLARLRAAGNFGGLIDAVMFLPYLVVVGVPMFAAGLSTAVEDPDAALSLGAAICLGGGLSLFYLANTIISVRLSGSSRRMLLWLGPVVSVFLVIWFSNLELPATDSLIALAVVTGTALVASTVLRRRRLTQSA